MRPRAAPLRVAVAWLLLATACGSCRGGLTDPIAPGDGPDPSDAPIASLRLASSVGVLAVGQSTVLDVEARTADDRLVPDPAIAWRVDPEGVVAVEEGGAIRGEAEGTVAVTAYAGDVASDPVELRVVAVEGAGEPSVRVRPGRVVVSPGATAALTVEARDGLGQRLAEPAVEWRAADPAIATVDEEGTLRGEGEGRTTVRAVFDGVESPPVAVFVRGAGAYPAVDWVEPSGEVSARAELRVRVRVQALTVGSPSEFGVPLTASSVEVRAGDRVLGTLTPTFGEAAGTVSLEGLAPGLHALVARATVEGSTVDGPQLNLTVIEASDAFEAVGDPQPGDRGSLASVDGAMVRVANDCTRECRIHAHRWSGEAWEELSYRRREWDAVGDWRDPSGYEEDVRDSNDLSLPRFVGWGWQPRSARAPQVLAFEGQPLVVWSNEEARTSFNEESMPERYWFDCYGAHWRSDAGHDGAGGFELLTTEGADYLYALPHPDAIGDRDQYQFPAGVDATRTHECASPRALVDGDGRLVVAHLAGPVPGRQWGLEVRTWEPGPGAWATVSPRLELEGAANPELRAFVRDASGRWVAAVIAAEGPSGVHRLQDGAWTALEEGTRRLTSLAATASGGVIGAGTAGGDMRVFLGADTRWSPLGFPLDAQPWAGVGEAAVLAADGTFYAAWTEGPSVGNRMLYVARWDEGSATWERLGGGPVDAEPDRRASRPSLTIDDRGHLWVLYTEHVGEGADDPFVQRVLRSREPVQ